MTRLARVALAVALLTALPSALHAQPQIAPARLTYSKVFDVDRTHGNFILAALLPQTSASLVTAALFGMDVPLPIYLQAPEPFPVANAPRVAQAPRMPVQLASGLTLRLHQSRMQVQYAYATPDYAKTDAAVISAPRLSMLETWAPSFASPPASAQSSPPLPSANGLAAGSSAAGTYSVSTPAGLPTPSDYAPFSSPQQGLTAQISLPVRVGPARFTSRFEGTQQQQDVPTALASQALCGSADPSSACGAYARSSERRYAAGTSFDVRAGAKKLNVDLTSSVEHFSVGDQAAAAPVPWNPDAKSIGNAAKSSLAAGEVPLVIYPSLSDVTRRGYNAAVAVPVSDSVTVNLQYNTQHYLGSTDSTVLPNVDARKDAYTGKVTYQLPHSNSAITVSARKYRFSDSLIPANNQNQTREDVNFTVKF